jgi:hypothetical protein
MGREEEGVRCEDEEGMQEPGLHTPTAGDWSWLSVSVLNLCIRDVCAIV